MKNTLVAFNTFVDCRSSILVGLHLTDRETVPPWRCTIANNLLVGTEGPLIRIATEPEETIFMGNIAYGTATGTTEAPGTRVADPQLVRGANALLRPEARSPVVDAAEGSFPGIARDIDGQRRSAPFDVGADERGTAPRVHQPVGPEDVGPDWMRAQR